jgi:hypothetical protein
VVEECGGSISRWWRSATAAAAANPRVQKDAQLARLIFLMTHDRGRANAEASQVRDSFFLFTSGEDCAIAHGSSERPVNFGWGEQVNLKRLIDVYVRLRSNFPA